MSNPRNGKVTHADELSKNEEVKEKEKKEKRKRKINDEVPQQVLPPAIEEQIDEEEVEDLRKSKRRRKIIAASPEPAETFSKATSAAAASVASSKIKSELPTSHMEQDEPTSEHKAAPSIPKKFGTAKFDLSSLPPIEAREFVAEDFDRLTENEYNRFVDNSNKIGHAVIMKDSQGHDIALQYQIPAGEKEETAHVRPLVNIEAIEKYGMKRYRAQTPDTHTIMYAKRFIDAEFTANKDNADNPEKLRIACFSPQPNGKEPFWGGKDKSTTIFKEFSKKSKQKELEAERKERGTTIKGGDELLVHGPSVKVRDDIKVRNPDQNTVMGESARDAYENFFNMLTDELDADVKKTIKRAFDAKINTWNGHYRPEWLHAYGFGLTPGNMDPQNTNNLGAAGKWCNTEMMILERIAKWFALNQPDVFVKIKPRFEMILDYEIVKKINFEVTLEDKKHFLRLIQEIDPFKEWPLFRKASDIAQGTAIAHSLMHAVPPVSNVKVKNGSTSVPAAAASAGKPSYALASAAPAAAAASAHVPMRSPASAFKPVSSSAVMKSMLARETDSPVEENKLPTYLKYENSIVEISSTFQIADYDTPWKGTDKGSCRGSGSVIEHNGKMYILTNAHVVENAVKLRVRLTNSKKKYEAKRVCTSYQSDLAIIEVTDPEFLAIVKPVELGEMVSLQQKVKTIGFPMGGSEISVTEGSVNRIEVRDYCQSGLDMLQVQVQSPLNPGNSGGPTFSGNKQVGVAFQVDRSGEALNYIIPMPVIDHFLKEAFSGKPYRGYPVIPVAIQFLENPSLRAYYGLKKDQTGIRISSVDLLTDAHAKLKADDVLLEIDGLPITNEGTVDVPGIGNCLSWLHVTQMKFIGDSVRLKVLRKNSDTKQPEIKDIEVILDRVPLETEKVGQTEWDKMPSYFISSGISFTPATRNYIESKGSDLEECRSAEYGCRLMDAPKNSLDEQLVVINEIFDCAETEGYEGYVNDLVVDVNGIRINNLKDVVRAIELNKDPVHVITTDRKMKLIVKNMSKEENANLLKEYKIKFDRSDDLIGLVHAAPVAESAPSVAAAAPVKPKSSSPVAAAAASASHDGPAPMEIDGDSSDEEEKISKPQELTAEDLPGYRKYRAKLDQMEKFYGENQLAEDEDLDEENDEDYDEDEEDESSYESDASEESTEEKEKKTTVMKFASKSSGHGFFKKRQESSGDESEDERHVQKRRFK